MLDQLSRLRLSADGTIDVSHSSPATLRSLAEDAETTLSTIHQGLGALGHLLAHSAVPIEDGTIGADSLESLGFLMAEMGDLAAVCVTVAAQCRRAAASKA
ncbi:hypothetical protein [Variovorax defluvii]